MATLDQGRLRELANSYLDHVLLIIKYDDQGANLRHFLDPWWSFTQGGPFIHFNGKGRYVQHTLDNPCPIAHHDRLLNLRWISVPAVGVLQRGIRKKDRKHGDLENRLVVEHAVPFKVIASELFSRDKEWDAPSLEKFLLHHYQRALLTKEEDKLLNENRGGISLRSEMPDDWKLWDDPFARYAARGIIRHEASKR